MGSSIAAIGVLILAGLSSVALADCAPGMVEVQLSGGQTVAFNVELADTAALRETGLMNRDMLPPGAGMLFIYPHPRHVYYWMKDTRIPLDILFADETGRVASVKAQAQPFDLTPIDGGEEVRFVLEINGGQAEQLGIAPGALLRADAMASAALRWPCP